MNDLIVEALGLLFGTFVIMAGFGWLLAGRAVSHHSAFERPRPHVFDAAETFTSGVVVPFKTAAESAPKPAPEKTPMPAYVPQPAPRYEMAASNVAILRDDRSLQTRVSGSDSTLSASTLSASTLVSMTPDSVAAAVQQAGNGLAPARLDAPKGAADDLTLISGIDEARQQALNELGIFHFWQVAGWTPEHVAWLSSRVEGDSNGGGRIARENWMAQALKLAQVN